MIYFDYIIDSGLTLKRPQRHGMPAISINPQEGDRHERRVKEIGRKPVPIESNRQEKEKARTVAKLFELFVSS